MDNITMNANDLRSILADEINKIRAEKTTPAAVNAIVNATGKILTTVKMELDYAKLIGITPQIDFINLKPMTVDARKALASPA